MSDVTDVLRDRMREPEGLRRMVSVSALLHGLALLSLMVAPRGWLMPPTETSRPVMTITLGGAGSGPLNGGMTAIGGRPVQMQTPPEEQPKREAVRAPARQVPEMTVPKPGAKVQKAPDKEKVKQSSESRTGTPTKGAEIRPGSAIAETGARGQGFGLSTGGGEGNGSTLDVADFCCPDYLVLMVQRIRAGWIQQADVGGSVVVRFTIERDGRITGTSVEKSSGYSALDLQAQRAVVGAGTLPPLPAAFPNPMLTVHLNFQYQR